MTLEQLQTILTKDFGPPFLAEGMVRAEFKTVGYPPCRVLQINIGRRDVWIEEDGHVSGAGTCMVEP
jgi:hypothetical protein